MTQKELQDLTGLVIYPASVQKAANGATYALGKKGTDKFIVAAGDNCGLQAKQVGKVAEGCVCVGELNHANALAVRKALPWTGPKCLGLATSAGLGDRLGLATPGHIRALRGTGLAGILAQQSIREMTRTKRTADEVMDAATWGVLQEGFTDGFGADADHLQKPEDADYTAAAGFKLFTIDPGAFVDNAADTADDAALLDKYRQLDFWTLGQTPEVYSRPYIGEKFKLADGSHITFDTPTFMRAAVKYGNAIAHAVKMAKRIEYAAKGDFELEISVDETDSPTSPAEHYFFAAELKRLGVKWVSMAPRFIGRFEKGVDYLGDLHAFRKSFAQHVAIMRTVGPYKMSIHSGSDKFSIYPIIAELAGPYVHLKTAGTSYLEAIRAIADIDPGLFREILDFAHERYETDKASYHVSAQPQKVPQADELRDSEVAGVLDLFDGRQLLHVTFGSVLTSTNADGSLRFRDRILGALKADEERHYNVLAKHIAKHLAPFAKK